MSALALVGLLVVRAVTWALDALILDALLGPREHPKAWRS